MAHARGWMAVCKGVGREKAGTATKGQVTTVFPEVLPLGHGKHSKVSLAARWRRHGGKGPDQRQEKQVCRN